MENKSRSPLLNNEQSLQRLIDAVVDYAIYMLDPEGFIVTWNSGAQALKGYRSIEIIGQHYSRFFTPEDQAKNAPGRALQEAARHGRYETEGWRVRRDGARFWANAVLDAIYGDDGAVIGFAKVTRDITARKAADDALAESERRFRLLVDGVTDYALYMLDPSGLITNWNTGAQRLKGYTAAEIVGQHFSRFYTPEDRANGLPVRVLEIAAREGRFDAEGWRVRKDGSRFWAAVTLDAIRSETGDLLGYAKITRDITERQAAQLALRDSERQLRLLFRSVTEYALYTLDLNGIVSSWNPGAERIKGYSADEIIGQHFSKFYTEHERSEGLPARALYTAATEGRYEAEGWRLRKDGTLFWCHVVIDPVRDEDGKLIGYAKITRDVTERREAQLARQRSELQHAYMQKMEALGQLTGGVAHDFNNLLMVISAQSQRIKRESANNAKLLHAAEAIEGAAKRGASLTRQLLSFSRRQVLNPVIVDIGKQISQMSTMISSATGPGVTFASQIAVDIWPIRVDPNEFELALLNLVINARDAMSGDGMLTIAADNVSLKSSDTSASIEGDFVAITLADTGCGIPEDVLPRVFDPFFTTKQGSNGTGLGLSQVHGFAHQSGGTATISSELGRGTRLTIYLPRGMGQADVAKVESSEKSLNSGRVLLVEDNPDVAEATSLLLEQMGLRVNHVSNAAAALSLFEQNSFDLIVSDVVMPGALDGLGLAKAIRSLRADFPILLVTGYNDAMASGASEFIVLRKPFGIEELVRAIANVMSETKVDHPSNLVRLDDVRTGPKATPH